MNQLGGFPLLTLIVAVPVLGAAIVLFLRPARGDTLHWLAVLIASADFFISLFLYMGWVPDLSGTVQFQDGPWPWIPSLGIQHHLAIDGVNVHLVGLTTLLAPLVLLAAWPHSTSTGRATTFWVLILEASTLGALTTRDLACFALFWLIALVSAFLLAGLAGYPSGAAAHYIAAMAVAAVLMLACLVYLSGVRPGLDIPNLSANPLPWQTQAWLFWALTLAMGITSALCPFHLWYIDTQRHASPPARVLISVMLLNMGCCGLIRFCLPAFPLAVTRFAPALVLLSTIGLAYAAVRALGQRTLPSALAYWNVAQMNLALIGIFSLQNLGLHGATFLIVGRALSTAILLLVGPAQDEQQRVPSHGANPHGNAGRLVLLLGFLSALAVPGSIEFIAQTALVLGMMRWHWQPGNSGAPSAVWDWLWYALFAFGLLVSAWTLLRSYSYSLPSTSHPGTRRQALLTVPLLLVTLLAGVRPSVFSDMTGPTVHRLLGEIMPGLETDLREKAPPASSPEEMPSPPSDQPDTTQWLPAHGHPPMAGASITALGIEYVITCPARTWIAPLLLGGCPS